jgi:hypothetical protein
VRLTGGYEAERHGAHTLLSRVQAPVGERRYFGWERKG